MFVLVGSWHQDRRKLAAGDPCFERFHAATAFIPFTGRGGLRALMELPPLAAIIGMVIALVAWYLRPEQLAKEIVALANFQGGQVLLGVEEQITPELPGVSTPFRGCEGSGGVFAPVGRQGDASGLEDPPHLDVLSRVDLYS